MQIKKHDTLASLSSIQKRNNELPIEEGKSSALKNLLNKMDKGENRENLGVDKIRNQVMNLHNEVKDIQTRISMNQIQIAFLETLPADSNWKDELQTFMKDQFSKNVAVKPEPDLNDYLSKLSGEIKTLNNDMLTREIKLENIVSSGIIDSEKSDISSIIIKDIQKAGDVFSKFKPENIVRVLKS